MKTKIAGWIYFVATTFLCLIYTLMIFGTFQTLFGRGAYIPSNVYQNGIQIMVLLLGEFVASLFGFIWSLALKRHKKWSWYFGIVYVPLILVGGLVSLFWGVTILSILSLLFNIFVLYALISEKKLFVEPQSSPVILN